MIDDPGLTPPAASRQPVGDPVEPAEAPQTSDRGGAPAEHVDAATDASAGAPSAEPSGGHTETLPDEQPADQPDEPAAPPKRLDVVIALDIGSSRISAGLVTRRGELIDRDQIAVDDFHGAEALFDGVVAMIRPLLDSAGDRHRARPIAIGVGAAGPITANVTTVSTSNIHAWREFPLRARLGDAFALPVFGELDARALALAEGWLGAAVGKENFVAMVVSTGVGGGVVLNGQLLEGGTGNAGHIGHVIVEPNGRRCPCGSRGCLEAEASGPAIESITGRPPTEPTYEIMQRTGRLVGIGAASVCNLLDIDLVVCGGPVALGFGAPFFNAAQDSLTEHARLAFTRSTRIVPARLGDRGPLIGAGAVGIRGLHRSRRGNGAT